MDIVKIIKNKLEETDGEIQIKLLKGDRFFTVKLVDGGVEVSNLGQTPYLEWKVFEKTIELLDNEQGWVDKGNGRAGRLGDNKVPLNSIEGYIAKEVYGKKIGDSVIRRITPIVNILIWVGVCENGPGKLRLK